MNLMLKSVLASMLVGLLSTINLPVVASEMPAFTLKDVRQDEQGFLRNTGTDGYLVFTDLNLHRAQACGLQFDLEFAEPLERPGIFDVFWRAPGTGGFSERHKAFFIVGYEDSASTARYVVPLCKLYHYAGNTNRSELQKPIEGLRLDYPANKDIGLKFHSFEFIDAKALRAAMSDDGVVLLEPYERVSPNSFTSLDVIVPKLVFAFEDGLRKLRQDPVFLIFWLALMLGLLTLIVRSYLPSRADK